MPTEIVYLDKYKAPDFSVKSTNLHFDLGEEKTKVVARYEIERHSQECESVWMDGEGLTLLSLKVDGNLLSEDEYKRTESGIMLACKKDAFTIEVEVENSPKKNLQLQGLYVSGSCLATQCESQGFRRIVYGFDRPDIFSVYDVTLEYDQNKYPLVIVAGECLEKEVVENGRAMVRYFDKTPKPTYLFALVAGYFNTLEDSYQTSDGENVKLYVHLPIAYPIAQAEFAMDALKKSMRWDEEVFNCVYDLDVYHIVGFADFNFGAMENKGLNIFNTSALLVDKQVATDMDYLNVLSVVGHEYFHNWTGNRVGCENWFQLSLKEGLTTYREMRFTCDSYCQMARLIYIKKLIDGQFKEDRGPTAHPVIPKSYQRIDNFYTNTIYTKGSEVLRMLEDLIGRDVIDQGIQNYLKKYDGKAVSIHEFIDTMQETAGIDLTQFKRWYDQVGTPHVKISSDYDSENKTLALTLSQEAAQENQRAQYKPLMMPVKMCLWTEKGEKMRPSVDSISDDGTWVVNFNEKTQVVQVEGVKEEPIISSFLGLSAPVSHTDDLTDEQSAALIECETDPYVKYIKAKECWMKLLEGSGVINIPDYLVNSLEGVLSAWKDQPELLDIVFDIPSLRSCQESSVGFDFDNLVKSHQSLLKLIAIQWEEKWQEIYQESQGILSRCSYEWNKRDINYRKARAIALKMLVEASSEKYASYAESLYHSSDNLTDRWAAIKSLLAVDGEQVGRLLEHFLKEAGGSDVLVNKWMYGSTFKLQNKGVDGILEIFNSDMCDHKQPNRVMAWLGGWCEGNYQLLHLDSGEGYAALTESIEKLDAINPVTASRMIGPLLQKQYFNSIRREKIESCLRSMQAKIKSANLQEKIASALET